MATYVNEAYEGVFEGICVYTPYWPGKDGCLSHSNLTLKFDQVGWHTVSYIGIDKRVGFFLETFEMNTLFVFWNGVREKLCQSTPKW